MPTYTSGNIFIIPYRMDYSNLELNHEANTLAQFEANLIEQGYIITCKVENIQLDSLGRPYEQTPNGKMMLPNNKLIVNRH